MHLLITNMTMYRACVGVRSRVRVRSRASGLQESVQQWKRAALKYEWGEIHTRSWAAVLNWRAHTYVHVALCAHLHHCFSEIHLLRSCPTTEDEDEEEPVPGTSQSSVPILRKCRGREFMVAFRVWFHWSWEQRVGRGAGAEGGGRSWLPGLVQSSTQH